MCIKRQIYRFTDLKTTTDVYRLAQKYSHELGYVLLGSAAVVVAFLIYKGMRKQSERP